MAPSCNGGTKIPIIVGSLETIGHGIEGAQLRAAFEVTPIGGREWGISLALGVVSIPLGAIIRLLPGDPFERLFKTLGLLSRPDVLPTTTPNPDTVGWNAITRVRDNLNTFANVRAAEPKPIRMFPDDPDLLLKLAACCKILLAGTIDLNALPRAQQLLEDYLAGFLKNHPDLVKPNFHYITHIFRTIRDFGPVYGFWTFLFERLNKLLKSYDTNNHGNGELELRKLDKKDSLELTNEERCIAESARAILTTDGDIRGTVASLACEIEQESADLGTKFSMGPAFRKDLPPVL
ncbi:hypothetical protein B0H13DRAFT_2380349 [Mycena leptocephala]|nr:hypothetical protein B0H13DRAFT_2380349 [Mycena leptocephala]